ncbi:MAG: protein kinase, partial [Oscillospiraceae bacterium]|nr:protein kinase [Oscillospiraceae bacterium]
MDSSDRYIGMLLDNRYEILEKIGAGGMAVVYKARCHRLNRLVAVKILKEDLAGDDEFRRRFHTESQAVAMLSHPNIVAVYDVSRTGNIEYIVMELIEGITLKQYINRKGLLNWKEALHFAAQITKALAHAHAKGIIHRDIKPHNIMILKDGSVKVADFGIAQLLSSQNTLTQGSMGSVHYISPEQAKGGRVDARTDIYSVGVVMYEMLTSQLPFVGDSAVSIAIQHISAIPLMPRDINPDVPPGLEDIAMHAMEPDMNMRYATADEMLLDLEEFRKNPAVLFNYAVLTAKQDAADPSATKPVPSGAILKTESALPSVRPVRAPKKPELTRDEYRNVHKRSGRTSVMIGVFVIIAFL